MNQKYRISFHVLEAAGPPLNIEVLARNKHHAISIIKEEYGSLLKIHDIECLDFDRVEPCGENIPQRGWVRRSERLPDVGYKDYKPSDECYLVTDGHTIWIDNRHPAWWGRDTRHIITHWMPLPELPNDLWYSHHPKPENEKEK